MRTADMMKAIGVRHTLVLLAALVATACSGSGIPEHDPAMPAAVAHARRSLPADLRGITYDDLSTTCAQTRGQIATERLLNRPTIRVVFDAVGPACYRSGVRALHRNGYIMGELVDSSGMKRYTLAQIASRVRAYLSALSDDVDLWEIGNEVNGNWLSNVACPTSHECAAQARDVMSKVEAMYAAAADAGLPTALTLSYNPPQTVTPGYDMLAWERTYVPPAMHRGLRYVLISYYETNNAGIRPSPAQWSAIFKALAADFPNAKVGFGEIGLPKPIVPSTLARATSIFSYYQSLVPSGVPRFTRAGFWWNAAEDLVPSTKWPSFSSAVRTTL
jgi:hypothetical protein